MRIVAFLFIIVICLTGCEIKNNSMDVAYNNVQHLKAEPKNTYNVYVENENYIKSKYEPESGCYLGAYILLDKLVESDIVKFETLTDKEHQIYNNYMKFGDIYPLQWVLECYSEQKIPKITLSPQDEYHIFDTTFLEETSKEFGLLNIPIFIELYPNPLSYGGNEKLYVQFYQEVKNVFSKNAPNVAFIWSIDLGSGNEINQFYPGDGFVDWIGINIYDDGKQKWDEQFWNAFNYFYYSFQNKKPLMVSQLAISHYSTENHSYEMKKSIIKLEEFYSKMELYPRIKGIVYMNFNNIDNSPKSAIRNNFTITGENETLNAYKKVVKNKHYVINNEKKIELFNSPFIAYHMNGQFYIAKKTAIYDLGKKVEDSSITINGVECIKINPNSVVADEVKKSLIIKSNTD